MAWDFIQHAIILTAVAASAWVVAGALWPALMPKRARAKSCGCGEKACSTKRAAG